MSGNGQGTNPPAGNLKTIPSATICEKVAEGCNSDEGTNKEAGDPEVDPRVN